MIPPRRNRKEQRDYGKGLYRKRNLVERRFLTFKRDRRIATDYERLTRLRAPGQTLLVDALLGVINNLAGLIENTLRRIG